MQAPGTNSSSIDLLNYAKLILSKVSFDESLFRREIRKFLSELKGQECSLLRQWCVQEFGTVHGQLLQEEFQTVA